MQTFKTVTQTQTTQVDCVHYTVAHAVLENAQKQVANTCFDSDCTGARYYIMCTQILANLTKVFYNADDAEYISKAEIIHAIADCLTYYDDAQLYDDCVANTALASENLYDYTYLSS